MFLVTQRPVVFLSSIGMRSAAYKSMGTDALKLKVPWFRWLNTGDSIWLELDDILTILLQFLAGNFLENYLRIFNLV